jgi:hypothetical protein
LFAVDTNILLYAAIEEFAEHEKAYAVLESWRKGETPWFVTWNCIYEFLRVSTHAAIFQKPLSLHSALEFFQDLKDSPVFSILNEQGNHFAIVKELESRYPRVAANVVHDFHTAAILYEQGIRVLYTADTDFLQFDFIKSIDPVH